MEIKDMEFGNIDAKPESQDDERFFLDSFYAPEYINKDDIYSGKKFIITGAKGTGKTALLRYLNSKKNYNDLSDFILFKSDIEEYKRLDFLANIGIHNIVDYNIDEIIQLDFEANWKYFFYKRIAEESECNQIFKNNRNWKSFQQAVKKFDNKTFLDNIKSSKINYNNQNTILTGAINNKFNISGDIEYEKNSASIFATVENIENQLKLLELIDGHEDRKFYFFIDELELSRLNEKMYVRDSVLIRDLLITVYKLNQFFKQYFSSKIIFICAVRSEVINSLYSAGKEINKLTESYGYSLSWTYNGGDYLNHPLIKIIIKKIRASDECKRHYSDKVIWNEYFEKEMYILNKKLKTENYILRQTYMKPRDIVRLFNAIKSRYGNRTMFTKEVFEGVRETYALNTWNEVMEELTVKYTPIELEAIKMLITGINNSSMEVIEKKAEQKAKYNDDLEKLINKFSIFNILKDLYRVGAIGNLSSSGKVRFSFRGQSELNIENKFIIHESIRKVLE